jgi:hypothetical protein
MKRAVIEAAPAPAVLVLVRVRRLVLCVRSELTLVLLCKVVLLGSNRISDRCIGKETKEERRKPIYRDCGLPAEMSDRSRSRSVSGVLGGQIWIWVMGVRLGV